MSRARDGVVLATAETQWVLVDMQSRTLTRIPQVLIDSFELVGD
ncbi:MAG: hypothetical protein QM775_26840 [Pirellulales bacterium]